MKTEHLLHGTEPLLRAAVFLVVLIAGASSDKVAESRAGALPSCVRLEVQSFEVGRYEMDKSM